MKTITLNFLVVFSLLMGLKVHAQTFENFIIANAIEISDLKNLQEPIFQELQSFRVISIGETHGTKEPSAFVTGLAKLFAEKGDSVLVGLEIPKDKMTAYLHQPSIENIAKSDFFIEEDEDGRASESIYELIEELTTVPKVKLLFYDITYNEYGGYRDSLMYLNLKKKLQEHPNHRLITLSGNIHNMLLPRNGERKMAQLLKEDKELNLNQRICSLNHQYT